MFSGIPLPKVVADVGPGGGIVTGMQGANALQQQILQNKFYPQHQMADINALNAQAQYHQNEANKINWMMSNPAYINSQAWVLTHGAVNNPNANPNASPDMGGNALNGAPPSPAVNNNAITQNPSSSGNSQQNNSQATTPNYQADMTDIATKTPSDKDSMGYNYGSLQQQIANPGVYALYQQARHAGVSGYNQDQNDASKDAPALNKMLQDLNTFHQAYQDSDVKGGYTNLVPSTGILTKVIPGQMANEHLADTMGDQLVTEFSKDLHGRLTNQIFKNIKGSKISRDMAPATELKIYNQLSSTLKRALKAQEFSLGSQQNGVPWNVANASWARLNQENPPYNPKTGAPNPDIPFDNYTSPDVREKLKSNKPLYKMEFANQQPANNKKYSDEDLQYTAKKHNMTVQQVKQRLGVV